MEVYSVPHSIHIEVVQQILLVTETHILWFDVFVYIITNQLTGSQTMVVYCAGLQLNNIPIKSQESQLFTRQQRWVVDIISDDRSG